MAFWEKISMLNLREFIRITKICCKDQLGGFPKCKVSLQVSDGFQKKSLITRLKSNLIQTPSCLPILLFKFGGSHSSFFFELGRKVGYAAVSE